MAHSSFGVNHTYVLVGEQAKRARRYLVMFMETRDIYIYMYICTSVSNTHVRVNVFLRIKFKS